MRTSFKHLKMFFQMDENTCENFQVVEKVLGISHKLHANPQKILINLTF